jgi:hypothetical protein
MSDFEEQFSKIEDLIENNAEDVNSAARKAGCKTDFDNYNLSYVRARWANFSQQTGSSLEEVAETSWAMEKLSTKLRNDTDLNSLEEKQVIENLTIACLYLSQTYEQVTPENTCAFFVEAYKKQQAKLKESIDIRKRRLCPVATSDAMVITARQLYKNQEEEGQRMARMQAMLSQQF